MEWLDTEFPSRFNLKNLHRSFKVEFEQGNLKKYEILQQVLILAAGRKNSDERLDQVLEFHQGDFDDWKLLKA